MKNLPIHKTEKYLSLVDPHTPHVAFMSLIARERHGDQSTLILLGTGVFSHSHVDKSTIGTGSTGLGVSVVHVCVLCVN